MGFYVDDLYIHRVPKFKWHDKLTNPPTVPETSPIIRVTALSPQLARVTGGGAGGGGDVALPADDTTLYTIPTPITPIVTPVGRLELADLVLVRENLKVTLEAVERQLEEMKPTEEELKYTRKVLG
ncbi:hypothetical protein IPV09_01210 [Tessaracoccus sp. SD287]|uniref:hypothetical protein n=1 Tax=Tessaracoccus sp. SD287 TaxID=2782008 RepID=UPI001A95A1CA|nr:hypothetical protein [Tessaracoccus sp. SD287]MBO1029952.1 hypothetical protein [Tessaracoccus sp. SD287]